MGKRGWLLERGTERHGMSYSERLGKTRSRAGMFFLSHSLPRFFLSWCFKKKVMQHTPGMRKEGELAETSTSALVLNFYIY